MNLEYCRHVVTADGDVRPRTRGLRDDGHADDGGVVHALTPLGKQRFQRQLARLDGGQFSLCELDDGDFVSGQRT